MVDAIGSAETAFIGLQALDFNNSAIRQSAGLTSSLRRGVDAPSSVVSTLQSGVAQLKATKLGLVRGETIVTVALNAGEKVQDDLTELRDLASRASDKSLTDDERSDLSTQFQTLRNEIDSVVSNAEFDSVNLLESGAQGITIVADETGRTLSVSPQDLSASGLGVEDVSIASSDAAADAVRSLDTAIEVTEARVGTLAEANGKIRAEGDQQNQLIRLSNPNVAAQVDTELNEQQATLLADEVRSNLGVKRLSIANVQSQSLLALVQS